MVTLQMSIEGIHLSGASPLVEVSNVTKTYQSGKPFTAVRDVSFQLPSNSYTVLVGPSGSGKSTLLHLLGCLDTPTTGTVEIDGHDITSLTETQRSRFRGQEIGFVFQSFELLPRLTALENVALPLVFQEQSRAQRRTRAKAMLSKVGLEARGDAVPSELSGGEQQRVAVARALISDPTFILADEPTGQLDQATGERLLGLFNELHAEGRSFFVVTHSTEVAAQAERVIHFRDGCIEHIETETKGEHSEQADSES